MLETRQEIYFAAYQERTMRWGQEEAQVEKAERRGLQAACANRTRKCGPSAGQTFCPAEVGLSLNSLSAAGGTIHAG